MEKFLAKFTAYLVELLVTKFYDKLLVPAVEASIEGGKIVYDKVDGKIKVRKLNQAEKDGNKDDYVDSVNDILG